MAGPVLIVGAGIAGTALGLELERAGVDFRIVASRSQPRASTIAAGLINPVAGQRFVKAWRIDEVLPVARAGYRDWGAELGVEVWHPIALRRRFASATERERARGKWETGGLAPYAESCDAEGLWVREAAWVDLPTLLAAGEARWRRAGRWVDAEARAADLDVSTTAVRFRGDEYSAAILCVGAGALVGEFFPAIPVVPAKGEILTVETASALSEARSEEHWLVPCAGRVARVGATYERGRDDLELTGAAREELLRSAATLAGGEVRLLAQEAGIRATTADRLPICGRHETAAVGILGGLGSKGVLYAPWLARQLAGHFSRGWALDATVSPQRFRQGGNAGT